MDSDRALADVTILVNQVGYDANSPKRVVLQCRRGSQQQPGRFSVVCEGTGQLLFAGVWEPFGPVNEGDDDWGFHYWRGDFTELERGGRVVIEAEVEGKPVRSPVFEIGTDVVWKGVAPLLVEYFRRARNTKPNGVLEGEERYYETSGAWYELGDRGGTLMRDAWKVLWALAQTRDRDPFLEAARDELLFGSLWWKRIMIHYPRTGRIISAAGGWLSDDGRISWYDYPAGEQQHEKLLSLALYLMLFRHLHDSGFLKRAEKMWSLYRDWITSDRIFSVYYDTLTAEEAGPELRTSWPSPGRNLTLVDDAAFLFGDVEMYRELKQHAYLEHARELVDRLLTEAQDPEQRALQWNNAYDHLHVTSLAHFAAHAPQGPRHDVILGELEDFFDAHVRCAESASPFGIARKNFAGCEAWRPRGRLRQVGPAFFDRRPEGLGTNPQLALEAWQALLVNRVVPKEEYRRFAQAHIDWILGLNPRGLCMVKGVGSVVPPMAPGGLFDGSVCLGLVSDGSRDRPWLGAWDQSEKEGEVDRIAGHRPWAQSGALLGGAGSLLLALSMT